MSKRLTRARAADHLDEIADNLGPAMVSHYRNELRALARQLRPKGKHEDMTQTKAPPKTEDVSQIREAISRSGLTQATICERLGIPQSALSKHLHGYGMGAKRKARLMEWAEEVLGAE